jgi:flagellum-specific ATP synthase
MKDIITPEHRDNVNRLIKTLATYKEAEDLINIGAYVDGSDLEIDFAKKMIGKINSFLEQEIDEKITFTESLHQLNNLFAGSNQ